MKTIPMYIRILGRHFQIAIKLLKSDKSEPICKPNNFKLYNCHNSGAKSK